MREQIEQALGALAGLPLWGTQRAADMQMFQFGRRYAKISRRGGVGAMGDYGLHVQCPWRIVGAEGIVVGSNDVYYPVGDPDNEPPDFAWDKIGANRRDERLTALFAGRDDQPLVVHAVTADSVGGVMFTLSAGYSLQLWPHSSRLDEHWRLLRHEDGSASHFVVTGAGIEE